MTLEVENFGKKHTITHKLTTNLNFLDVILFFSLTVTEWNA